jgi:hypothetical protein
MIIYCWLTAFNTSCIELALHDTLIWSRCWFGCFCAKTNGWTYEIRVMITIWRFTFAKHVKNPHIAVIFDILIHNLTVHISSSFFFASYFLFVLLELRPIRTLATSVACTGNRTTSMERDSKLQYQCVCRWTSLVRACISSSLSFHIFPQHFVFKRKLFTHVITLLPLSDEVAGAGSSNQFSSCQCLCHTSYQLCLNTMACIVLSCAALVWEWVTEPVRPMENGSVGIRLTFIWCTFLYILTFGV